MAACFLASSVSAQNPNIVNGYYISTRGDSMTGQIHVGKINGNNFYFKDRGQKTWKNLGAGEVAKAGGDNGLVILPREIRMTQDTEYVFVHKTAGGGYNIFEGKSPILGNVFYINSKDNETLVRVNKLGFDTQLKTMLAPCSRQVTMQKIRYSGNNLERYIAEINRCAYPGEQPYRFNNPTRFRLGVGLSGFYYRINPVITTNDDQPYYGNYLSVNKPGVALTFRLDIIPSFSVFTGITYIDKNMRSDSVVVRIGYRVNKPGIPSYEAYDYYKFSAELNFKYVEVPFGIAYTVLPYHKWSPVFSVGVTIQKSVANQLILDYGDPICQPCIQDPGPSDLYSEKELPLSRSYESNFFGGVALRRQFGRNHHIEFNLTFYRQE